MLLARASKITVDTSRKFNELKGKDNLVSQKSDRLKTFISEMTTANQSKEDELTKMQAKIMELNNEIETYTNIIQAKSDHFRQCTS